MRTYHICKIKVQSPFFWLIKAYVCESKYKYWWRYGISFGLFLRCDDLSHSQGKAWEIHIYCLLFPQSDLIRNGPQILAAVCQLYISKLLLFSSLLIIEWLLFELPDDILNWSWPWFSEYLPRSRYHFWCSSPLPKDLSFPQISFHFRLKNLHQHFFV